MKTIEEKSFEYKENVDLSNICDTKDVRFEIQDDTGLMVEFLISRSEEDVAVKIEEGIISEMSIGYSTVAFDYNTKDEIRTIKEARLKSFQTKQQKPLELTGGFIFYVYQGF